ncbi:hypothetical protein [Geodermatophilus sp. SYSU D01119]
MTSTRVPADRRDALAVLGVLALSAGVAVLALATARGVVPLGGSSVETEFISPWWWLAFLLAPLPAVAARRRTATGLAAGVVLVVPQVVAAAVCVQRYRTSGWGDGLEVFAYLHPLLLTVVTAALLAVLSRR